MNPNSGRQKRIFRVTITGSIVNLLLLAFKFLAGFIGHSSAMLADAIHSLSDFATDFIVLFFVRIAGKKGDADHAYGHGKFETLASLLIGVALLFVGLGLFANGALIIAHVYAGAQIEAPNAWALWAAILSLVLKEWLYRYTLTESKKLDCQALAVNAWHHRSDALTSIATLAGISGAMLGGDSWRMLDPLAAVIVSCFIIKMSWDLLKPCLEELMEKSLPEEDTKIITRIIASTPGIISFHNLRTRRIGAYRGVDVHIKMRGDMSLRQAHDIATTLETSLKNEFGAESHVGIHMEPV